MVWMITVIGFTLGIPDTVMGLTFIAAGVSVPDALSGVAVVKEGKLAFSKLTSQKNFSFLAKKQREAFCCSFGSLISDGLLLSQINYVHFLATKLFQV